MTAYMVEGIRLTGVAIKAISFDIRIIQVTVMNTLTSTGGPGTSLHDVNRYDSSTISGTAVTAAPLRGGSPAATAQCKTGGSVAASGTAQPVGAYGQTGSGILDWSPPTDLIVPIGSAILFEGDTDTYGDYYVFVYFEELRLSWHK